MSEEFAEFAGCEECASRQNEINSLKKKLERSTQQLDLAEEEVTIKTEEAEKYQNLYLESQDK